MFIVILFSILAIIFTYLEVKYSLKGGMKLGFSLVTLLGVIHYDYGSDYMAYYDVYNDIISYPFDIQYVLDVVIFRDPGWVVLCHLFKYLGGFFSLIAFLAILQNVIVYKTIRKYVSRSWWPISVFIYLFNSSLYLLSFSMLRQSLVIFIFLGCWPLIEKKKILLSLLILIFCSFIHKSSMILLPLAFWGYLPVNKGKILSLFFVVIFSVLWISKDLMNNTLEYFLSFDSLSSYETYGNSDVKMSFGLGYLLGLIPFILSLFYLCKSTSRASLNNKRIVALSMISFFIIPFSLVIPLVNRIAMFFYGYSILSIPMIYGNVNTRILRYGLLSINIMLTMVGYMGFYNSPIYGESYRVFHTVFSQIF